MTNCSPTMSRLDAVALGQTLPKVSSELLRLLSMCSTEVDTLIKDGQFGFVYQPTMLSKDIAIALEDTTVGSCRTGSALRPPTRSAAWCWRRGCSICTATWETAKSSPKATTRLPRRSRTSKQLMARSLNVGLAAAVGTAGAIVMATLLSPVTEAHKAITSPYNYNDHVFPILRERCSRCHFEGGPTPMSLMSYKDAIPWAESIREQLVGEKMPPWYPDMLGPAVKAGHPLPTRELDVLVTWAVGGTPQATWPRIPPPFVPRRRSGAAGEPDVKIAMAAEHTLPAGTMEETKEFLLPTGFTEVKWVKAADLMPGRASMVRDAVVSVENGPVLAAWVPGHEATAAPSGAAFKMPAGAQAQAAGPLQEALAGRTGVARRQEHCRPLPDRRAGVRPRAPGASPSTARPPARQAGEAHLLGHAQDRLTHRRSPPELRSGLQDGRRSRRSSQGGRKVPLLQLRSAQPQWYRRYWLAEPIELPAGAKIEIVATPAPPDEFAIPIPQRYPLQVNLDYVAQ